MPDRAGRMQAEPGKPISEHADRHRRNENERARIEESDIDERGAWANPGQPPADSENEAAGDQRPIDRARRRQLHGLAVQRDPLPLGEAERDEADLREHAAHHESQRRIPKAGKIEEAEHLGRLRSCQERAQADAECMRPTARAMMLRMGFLGP